MGFGRSSWPTNHRQSKTSSLPNSSTNLDTHTHCPQINSKGGLKAIVISHPHFYTTYVEWAQAFNCPVYVSADDQEWLCRQPPIPQIINFIKDPVGTIQEVVPGVRAVKLGGHFPGSLVLHWEKKLLIADTLMTVPVSG